MNRRHFLEAMGAAALAAAAPLARAQGKYPDQLIKWVVPYPAGGGTDNLARTLAESMRAGLGQQIIIDNRPGAATNIGAEQVANAKPDGYTVMSADNGVLAFNEHLFRKLAFSPEKDFTYIGAIGKFPLVLVVHPAFPAADFKAFMARVQAEPGKVDYASVGNGSPHHLAMELFQSRTGVRLTHVPYRGAAPAMQDVMGGQVPVMFLDLASGARHHQGRQGAAAGHRLAGPFAVAAGCADAGRTGRAGRRGVRVPRHARSQGHAGASGCAPEPGTERSPGQSRRGEALCRVRL